MTDLELGEKVIQAVGAYVYANGSSPLFDQAERERQQREQQELLGKLMREILAEGVRT